MRTKVLISMALLLFGATLGIDRAWVRPVLERTQALEEQRSALQARLGARAEDNREADVLAVGLGLRDLSELSPPSEDALVFLNRKIEATGLRQVELVVDQVVETIRLRESGFTLTVHGDYERCVALVRALEDDPLLVRVNGVRMGTQPESSGLECRLTISIFDPLTKARS
jgi:hypothetical protein